MLIDSLHFGILGLGEFIGGCTLLIVGFQVRVYMFFDTGYIFSLPFGL